MFNRISQINNRLQRGYNVKPAERLVEVEIILIIGDCEALEGKTR